MFALVTSHSFERQLTKFIKHHPELKGIIADIFRRLEKDPFQKALRLHALQGQLDGLFAVRLTYKYRITLIIRLEKEEIILLDIGSHDEVYRKNKK